jgi:hypothetical protein
MLNEHIEDRTHLSSRVVWDRGPQRLQEKDLDDTLPPSLPIQRPGVRTRGNQGAKRPKTYRGVFFRLRYGFMAAVRGRPSGLPVALIAGFSPRARLSPKPVRRLVAAPQIKDVDHEQDKSV